MDFLTFIGTINFISIAIFIVGVALMVVELFNPGFGAAGIAGIILLVVDIFMTARTFRQGLIMSALVAVLILVFLILGTRIASKGKLPKSLVLSEATDTQSGFVGASDYASLKGKTGTVVTMLRPAGMAEIDGRRVDVVSQGSFIDEGTEIVVAEVEGNRVVVKIKEEE